ERFLAGPGQGRRFARVPVLEAERRGGDAGRVALRHRHLARHRLHAPDQGLADGRLLRLRLREIPVTSSRPDAGFSVVLAVFAILILITMGLAMVSLVSEDYDL